MILVHLLRYAYCGSHSLSTHQGSHIQYTSMHPNSIVFSVLVVNTETPLQNNMYSIEFIYIYKYKIYIYVYQLDISAHISIWKRDKAKHVLKRGGGAFPVIHKIINNHDNNKKPMKLCFLTTNPSPESPVPVAVSHIRWSQLPASGYILCGNSCHKWSSLRFLFAVAFQTNLVTRLISLLALPVSNLRWCRWCFCHIPLEGKH